MTLWRVFRVWVLQNRAAYPGGLISFFISLLLVVAFRFSDFKVPLSGVYVRRLGLGFQIFKFKDAGFCHRGNHTAV